jgi:hypothetical protein
LPGLEYALIGAALFSWSHLFRRFYPASAPYGEGQEHHGEILASATSIAEEGKLKPLLNANHFSTSDIDAAYAAVGSGSLGKWSLTFVILDSQGLISSSRLNPCVRMPQGDSPPA